MRTKSFVVLLLGALTFSVFLIVFEQHKPETIQNIVTTTHEQIRNFQVNLRGAENKKLVADEKYLKLLDLSTSPRLYPKDVWQNTSLPVVVTYVLGGQESQAVGLINNVGKILPNNTILVYNLGVGYYGSKTLTSYCNSSRCQVVSFSLSTFPSHVEEEKLRAYRPIIIQDALKSTGSVLFMECSYRFLRHVTSDMIMNIYNEAVKNQGITAWPMTSKNPVSSLTHKKMFEYFHTDAENFIFRRMVMGDVLLIVNTESIHKEIMLPWIQCALTQDCIMPIGAQSAGCRFDKKPQYRYSGCHSYDTSALNIVLGLREEQDGDPYTYGSEMDELFEVVPLNKADSLLRELEQNATTEGRFSFFDTS